ncbi:hypothetical protein B566_EDAN000928 [Ephemera danica]|nr:hypothetical protein B566_EDAN000928 [Ephemera danica]
MSMSGMAILVYIGLSALREGLQVYQQRWHYLLDPFNLVSWLLYISAAAMVIPLFTGGLANVQFDQVGIYVVMFLEILQTLIKVLLVFSILIIAFGLALFILLSRGQHLAFNTVPMSLMRTFAMMLGEIDFLGTYVHSLYNRSDDGGRGRSLPYPVATFVILGIFMVFMPILLMNLLIGLAVGDIESVRRNAQLKRLAMQVVLHTELERKLPRMLLERVDKIEMIEYPNDHKCKKGFLDSVLRKWFCNPFSEEAMALDCTDELVLEELDKQRRRLREMSVMLEGQHQLLRLIVQKMEIKTEADDVDEGVSPRDMKNGSLSLARWTSPRLDKKTRSMLSQSRHSPT